MNYHQNIVDIMAALGSSAQLATLQGLKVTTPWTGENIAHIEADTAETLNQKVSGACEAQQRFAALGRAQRSSVVERYAAALKENQDHLAGIIYAEAGKTMAESGVEAGASSGALLTAIKSTMLADVSGMQRTKERPPVGVVGLITSFNFPMAVAHWTAGAALLAGNAVIWKPSEKTPLSAIACKAVFDKAVPEFADLFQVIIANRDVGKLLVAHEDVDMISATGSVGMGQAISQTLAAKKNNAVAPILELGGNNGIVITEQVSPEHLAWSVESIMRSFLPTTGQRCTNTRRVIIHKSHYDKAVALFTGQIEEFLESFREGHGFTLDNPMGYGALIDEAAYRYYEQAKDQAIAEGGRIIRGALLTEKEEKPKGYYIEPCLALMPEQTSVMHSETFAPLLYLVPYEGELEVGLELLNAPENSGLVGAIYTLSQKEADQFSTHCDAGHALINSSKGTGTPAYGMGFGGNKESGCGEILNGADPLAPFTRAGKFTRIAQNTEIEMRE